MNCPRCQALNPDDEPECGSCGVVFAKLDRRRPPRSAAAASDTAAAGAAASAEAFEEEPEGWAARARELLFGEEHRTERSVVYARGGLLALLALWSVYFFSIAMEGGRLAASVMHLVNLPFHEAGHVVFAVLGQFMATLGGSLMQLLVPLVCLGAFLQRKDRFGAAVGLWWAGQSLMDLAPYIADARALQLVLLGGGTGAEQEGHDWEAILIQLGLINHDVTLGRLASSLGIVLMLAALAWAARTVLAQARAR